MRILIVDDNQDNRMTIELLLEDIDNVQIDEAVDGVDAITKCKDSYYELIFMDIMMPNIDGIEATKEIKKLSSSSMIIALSALDDEKSKHAMIQNGAEDYITKPIDSELFMQRVKNYISIILTRKKPIQTKNVSALFSDNTYPVSQIFTIDSQESLSYFWDYFLNSSTCKAKNISDVVRLIYGIGLWLLKTNHSFTITAEHNDDFLFLTQKSLDSINDKIVRSILLKHCTKTPFILKDGSLSFKLTKIDTQVCSQQNIIPSQQESEKTYKDEILSKTHFDKITAIEYVENTPITLMDKIESLEELEDRLDMAVIDFESENSIENLQNISKLFLEYVEVIEQLVEFEHLSFSIVSLCEFLSQLQESQFDEKRVKKLITLMISLVSDLSSWRINIFIKKEANDIHYLDSSLLSSCLQIESIFQEEESKEDDDDDLEFF